MRLGRHSPTGPLFVRRHKGDYVAFNRQAIDGLVARLVPPSQRHPADPVTGAPPGATLSEDFLAELGFAGEGRYRITSRIRRA